MHNRLYSGLLTVKTIPDIVDITDKVSKMTLKNETKESEMIETRNQRRDELRGEFSPTYLPSDQQKYYSSYPSILKSVTKTNDEELEILVGSCVGCGMPYIIMKKDMSWFAYFSALDEASLFARDLSKQMSSSVSFIFKTKFMAFGEQRFTIESPTQSVVKSFLSVFLAEES